VSLSRSRSHIARLDPINPVPPVISTVAMVVLLWTNDSECSLFAPQPARQVLGGAQTISHRGVGGDVIQHTDRRHLFCATSKIVVSLVNAAALLLAPSELSMSRRCRLHETVPACADHLRFQGKVLSFLQLKVEPRSDRSTRA
jgi:hypothetical protein